ncbi:RibD family protein, partial [Nocardia farcinica]|uniref:RibD family protein n=1 Tax=Nocardia farcinica TaxID=37329 RepID=UPI00313C2CF8
MSGRPYVLLSAAMSLDGHLDDVGPERLRLSDAADFDRVDRVRAESDAILVGAQTLRRDDPRLLVADQARGGPPGGGGRPPGGPAPRRGGPLPARVVSPQGLRADQDRVGFGTHPVD